MYNLFVKSNKKRAKRRGFTLIELVIVIVILGILAGVAALSFNDVTKSSKVGVAKANLRAMKSACQIYQAEHSGRLPKTIAKLEKYFDTQLKADINGGAENAEKFTYKLEENGDKGIKIAVTGNGLTGSDVKNGDYYEIDGPLDN